MAKQAPGKATRRDPPSPRLARERAMAEMAAERSSRDPEADWAAALRGDREAFKRALAPFLGELLDAAARELRYHKALGDFSADAPTAEELVGEVLIRAWGGRRHRSPQLGLRAWLIGLVFRAAHDLIRGEARYGRLKAASLEGPPPRDPFYDDDEEFWEWYQPDEATHLKDVVGDATSTPEEIAVADEDFDRALPPRARQVLLMHDAYGVALSEIALTLCISEEEAQRILSQARRRLGKALSGQA